MTRQQLYIDAKVMSQPRVSGIGHSLHGLVRAMQEDAQLRERYRTTLLAPWDGYRRLRQLGLQHVEYVRLPLPTRGYDRVAGLPWLPALDRLVGRGIYVFPHYGNWPLRHSPSMTFIHDVAFLRHPETVGGDLALLTRNMQRWAARTTLIATVSTFSRAEIIELLGVAAERIVVIPWGVDRSVFHARPAGEVAQVRRRHGLPERYILYLGNIEPRKNLVRLIGAYRALPPIVKQEFGLVLVGGAGWNTDEIRAAVTRANAGGDNIILPSSYVTDAELPALLSGAAALAQPSLYEGFGIAPLQSMACGVPAVVGDNSAQPEVGGNAVVYVDALDVDDIAAGLLSVLTDEALRATLIARGLEQSRHLSWERSAAAMAQGLGRLTA